ncbi:aspartate kinase [Reinekea sp.]|uniref:aspartate kinase n=1 Tax=Reinekea sp. TaxID=1970455 RepID=UPI002A7F0C5F|nr:aspartate kinase [Reinekea sp.]
MHTIEKIGGTSMNDYVSVRDNIVFKPSLFKHYYHRVFVVSAYGGVTDKLLEYKKSGKAGVFKLFASSMEDDSWLDAITVLNQDLHQINAELFGDTQARLDADQFINDRIIDARQCLLDLQSLCHHGHFALDAHLATVREMLASLGEAHSAWNTAKLLQRDGVNACFVDLTGWRAKEHMSLDERIQEAFASIDLNTQLPIVTGYAHSENGLMSSFNRGYSEMTFSRLAVLTEATEAIIHKEFHLSSADPRLVGETNAVPIGRTNYDVADQLANLGMEAIHPKAAKGLRQSDIPLRIKNTFEPEHTGTLITGDYVSDSPRVEIVAGTKGVYALEIFDQDMAGLFHIFDPKIVTIIKRFKAHIVSKDINANSVTHYLTTNLKTVKRIRAELEETFPEAEVDQKKGAIVSVIGSDLKINGLLAQTALAISTAGISIMAVHQCMRQVDVQFVIHEEDYATAVKALHQSLIEIHDHGRAICLAS